MFYALAILPKATFIRIADWSDTLSVTSRQPRRQSQVAPCYPKRVGGFVDEVTALLQTHAAVLDPSLRRTLVKALILMRNRDQVCAVRDLD